MLDDGPRVGLLDFLRDDPDVTGRVVAVRELHPSPALAVAAQRDDVLFRALVGQARQVAHERVRGARYASRAAAPAQYAARAAASAKQIASDLNALADALKQGWAVGRVAGALAVGEHRRLAQKPELIAELLRGVDLAAQVLLIGRLVGRCVGRLLFGAERVERVGAVQPKLLLQPRQVPEQAGRPEIQVGALQTRLLVGELALHVVGDVALRRLLSLQVVLRVQV